MDITKAHWSTDGDDLCVTMPLSKVDEVNRIVSGFATLDNQDSQDDVVTKAANLYAFTGFVGNIREMHQPIAAGRMVKFREDTYFDPETKALYEGIWVDVYVSKGAESTWEKVLDGTLRGFSIGGSIIDSDTEVRKMDDGSHRPVRVVKKYELTELSLVDSPANKLANIFSITKVDGGATSVSGLIADAHIENVMYCDQDKVAKATTEDSAECHNGHKMENIGWIDYSNPEDKITKMSGVIDGHLNKQNSAEEGGANVSEKEKEVEKEEVEKVITSDDVQPKPEDDDKKEDAKGESEASESEVDSEDDLTEKYDSLRASIEEAITKNSTKMEEITTRFDEFTKAIDAKFEELATKHGELTEKFAGLKDSVDSVEKSMDGLEKTTAIKKSSDLGGSKESQTEKSGGVWANVFFPAE